MAKSPTPKFNIWEAVQVSLHLGAKALEEIRDLARTPGPAGKDGRDGNDAAIPFDGIERWYEDDGRIEVMQFFCKGEVWKEIRLKTTQSVYRGIFDTSRTYERGDEMTHGGNVWWCKEQVSGAFQIDKWILKSKKGRDAREGR